jgi:transposase-like protein
MITAANEGYDGWKLFLTKLDSDVPILKQPHPLARVTHSLFTFVSDCDKGLEPALAQCFPNNHSTYCAIHIQRNVWTKFGHKAAASVVNIAKTFSARIEDSLLEELEKLSRPARVYLENIERKRWRSSEWVRDGSLPPRYGITSSNIS